MTTTVLAYFPSPAQGVWYLGPVPIRAYALCIIAGIIAALVIGDRRWAARGGERGVIYDIALWAVPFGLIGGRIYHLLTDWRTYFGEGGAGIGAALRIWEGGLGIWGAIAFGGVGAWIACRRRGIPLPAFGDAVAPGIVLAQAIGRLGNYFNQELYGRETTVPWGMEIFYRRDSSGVVDVHSLDGVSTGQVAAVVHPTFLYELLWNLLVFALLLYADRKYRLGHGRLFALYVASYCVGRFWVELMRDDSATLIAGIRVNVFTAMFVFIGAVVYMLLAPKGREDPATLRGNAPAAPDEESPIEESPVEELAEEMVAAAMGSGLLAAVTVAGEHEQEDAEAVGDEGAEQALEDAQAQSEFVSEVEAEELAAESVLEDEIADSQPPIEVQPSIDVQPSIEVVIEPATDAEHDVLEAESMVAVAYETEDEIDSEAELSADDGPVVIYAAAPESETVVLFDSGPEDEQAPEEQQAPEELQAPDDEQAVDTSTASDVDVEIAAEPEPEPEPDSEPQPDPEGETATRPAGFSATLRRLLWGVSSTSKD